MKHNFKLISLFISAVIALSAFLPSCSESVREIAEKTGEAESAVSAAETSAKSETAAAHEDAETEAAPSAPAGPWDGYTIIRSDFASDGVIAAVVALRKAFQAAGVDIKLGTDFLGRGETAPESAKEILVGATTRAPSDAAMNGLRLGDWRVGYDPDTGFVTVAGGSEAALSEACAWLAENAAGGPETIPAQGASHTEDYPLADLKVLGYSLSEYVLVGVPEAKKAQELMARLAADNCGVNVRIDNSYKSGPVITFLTDETMDGYRIETKGGLMSIYGSDGTQLYAAVADMFVTAMGGSGSIGLSYTLEGRAELTPVKMTATDEASLRSALSEASDIASRGLYDIKITVSPGLHDELYLSSPITMDGDDFGVSKLYIESEGGAAICGGMRLSGEDFAETEINGVKCWAIDIPEGIEPPRDVYITSVGNSLSASRVSPASLPEGSMIPEEGEYYHVSGIPGAISLSDYATFEGSGVFTFREDIPALTDPASAQMVMYHYWEQERFGIKEFDASSKTITLSGVTSMNLMSGGSGGPAVFRIENVREALNQPGEFYVDRTARRLYIIPDDGAMTGKTVWLGGTEQAFVIKNMSGLSFGGIGFTCFGWQKDSRNPSQGASDLPGVIELTSCSDISFDGCIFSHDAYYPIKAVSDVSRLTVERCLFSDLGSGAVHLGGENTPEGCVRDCVIRNNVIRGYGRDFADGIGVLARYVNGCVISHNDISEGYYTGVSCGWTWGYSETVTDSNEISFNRIYDIGKGVLSDLGGIYTLGPQARTVLRGNVIHGIDCRDYGGWGIYLDEGSSGILVTENLCYDFNANAFHQHYGRENLIINNIFAFGDDACIAVTRKEDHISFRLERNILLQNGADIYNHVPSDMNVKDFGNLIWDMAGEPMSRGKNEAQMRMAGYYDGCLIENPLFIDPLGGDFTLGSMSPAYKIGFTPFDTSLAGVEAQ